MHSDTFAYFNTDIDALANTHTRDIDARTHTHTYIVRMHVFGMGGKQSSSAVLNVYAYVCLDVVRNISSNYIWILSVCVVVCACAQVQHESTCACSYATLRSV